MEQSVLLGTNQEERMEALEDYYLTRNESILMSLGVNDFTCAVFGPFAEKVYDSLGDYYAIKSQLYLFSSLNIVSNVEVTIQLTSIDAVASTSPSTTNYNWQQVKSDGGIPLDSNSDIYTGEGIKVGVIEPGVPSVERRTLGLYTDNLTNPVDYTGSDADLHATFVMSTIGGNLGLAPQVHIYHSVGGVTISSLNFLAQNNVDVINISLAVAYSQQYDNYAARMDYFV